MAMLGKTKPQYTISKVSKLYSVSDWEILAYPVPLFLCLSVFDCTLSLPFSLSWLNLDYNNAKIKIQRSSNNRTRFQSCHLCMMVSYN